MWTWTIAYEDIQDNKIAASGRRDKTSKCDASDNVRREEMKMKQNRN